MLRTAKKIIEAKLAAALEANNAKDINDYCIVLKAFNDTFEDDYESADKETVSNESIVQSIDNDTVIDQNMTAKIKIEDVIIDSDKAKDIISILNDNLGDDLYEIKFEKNNLTDQYESIISISPQDAPNAILALEAFNPVLV